jgi:hypothetical protein
LAVFAGTAAQAGFLDVTVSPNPKDIFCPGNKKIGALKIEDYYAWESDGAGNFTPRDPSDARLQKPGNNSGGARLQAFFDITDKECPRHYRWIQAVTGGTSTIGTPPYIDPFAKDDTLPFYWTNKELPSFISTNKLEILDIPGQPLSEATVGNPASVDFETALVCWWDKKIHLFQSFTWGYEIVAKSGGGYDVGVDSFAWTTPSTTLTNLITGFDGNDDGKPDGWQITDDCCPCIPEPTSLCIWCIGVVTIIGLRRAVLRR